jgi:demethylmenaquinone methyltransferase/2-methoxy-6-polyprenyl-1,4-benzoquinol methylase
MADPRSTTPHLETYYDRRAGEYEKVYEKPERQHELEWLRRRIPELLADRTVLEVACGTGYWTQFIARAARRVEACDINESVLEIAREKPIPKGRVNFFKADAVSLAGVPAGCDAAFAGFWWSHVKKSELVKFVANLAAKVEPGARLVVLDNRYFEGSSTAISRRDAEGNTYQLRALANGEEYEVLKNFPTPQELADAMRPMVAEAHLESLKYYWLLVAEIR